MELDKTLYTKSTNYSAEKFDEEKGIFSGYCAVFNTVDKDKDVIMPGAFKKSIQQSKTIPLLWQHDHKAPIGKIIKINEDKYGLYVEAQINMKTAKGREVFELLKGKDVSSMSFGYAIKNAENIKGVGRKIYEVDIFEVSLVTFPANENAKVKEVKSAASKVGELIKEVAGYIEQFIKLQNGGR